MIEVIRLIRLILGLVILLYVLYRYSVYDKQPSWIEVMVILLALE
jgi:hypothetical protein